LDIGLLAAVPARRTVPSLKKGGQSSLQQVAGSLALPSAPRYRCPRAATKTKKPQFQFTFVYPFLFSSSPFLLFFLLPTDRPSSSSSLAN
jgi:hypothetical protein